MRRKDNVPASGYQYGDPYPEIVAILDIENSSVSKITREFFAAAQSRGEIIYLSGTELPKSFLLCESDGVGRVYVSHLAPSTLRRRVENTAAALR